MWTEIGHTIYFHEHQCAALLLLFCFLMKKINTTAVNNNKRGGRAIKYSRVESAQETIYHGSK